MLLLAPHLTAATADDLLAAAAFKTKDEIRLLIAQRFPKPDVPTRVEALPASPHRPHRPGQAISSAQDPSRYSV